MITWINCSERMPPDDETKHIVISNVCPLRKCMGRNIWQFVLIRKHDPKTLNWTPYTKEAWEELSK